MPMPRFRTIVLAAACIATLPDAATAQQQTFGPSLEAGAGLFLGGGGTFEQRGGPTIDAVVAVPLARTSAGTLVGALTGGISGPLSYDLVCAHAPNGGCVPDYPTFASIGAVAGVQRALGESRSVRALAGAGFYQDVDGPGAMGLQGRVDVAQRLVFRASLVASVRGAVLPRYQGEALSFAAFGLGLRIQ